MMDDKDLLQCDQLSPPASAPASSGSWMIIFTDLLSLLLTFFVLMFSMNAVQVEDWQAVVDTLSDRLNPNQMMITEKPWDGYQAAEVDEKLAEKLEYLGTIIDQKLGEDPVLKHSHVELLGDRLVISLPADFLFEAGSARFASSATRKTIEKLGNILRSVNNQVAVSGHADPPPVRDENFPSNWELSLVRAIAVSTILQDSGYSKPIVTFGNGDAGIEELGLNLTFEEKTRLARRIDIIVREADAGDRPR